VSDCEELVGVTHRRWCEWTGVCRASWKNHNFV